MCCIKDKFAPHHPKFREQTVTIKMAKRYNLYSDLREL